jgi:hypothetical protein
MSFALDTPARESAALEVAPMLGEDTSLAVKIVQAELNQAITTARAFPRSLDRAMKNILTLATLDQESAIECIYAVPRAGKAIRGPSVRFAEIIASQWGNCHVGSRIIAVDPVDKVVIAEGVFHDLETGMKRIAQVRRRISDKNGKLFNEDMIVTTGNAASAIAMREAVLKGVPKAIWRRAYEACDRVIAGDVKTIVQRRDEAMKAMAVFGVTPDQVCAYLEVAGISEITPDHLATITAAYYAIKKGEQAVEDYFEPAPTQKQKKQDAPAKEKQATNAPVTVADAAQTNAEAQAAPEKTIHEAAYDKITTDILDGAPIEGTRQFYAAQIAAMETAAPELHRRLIEELAEAERQAAARQGGQNE